MQHSNQNNTFVTIVISVTTTLAIIGVVALLAKDQLVTSLAQQLDVTPNATSGPSDNPIMSTGTTAPFIANGSVVDTIAAVNPAVVSVIVTRDVPVFERFYEDSWFGWSVPRVRSNGTEQREVGGGSGFLVSSDGLIVTNRHVVDDREADYSVVLTDGNIYEAEVVARDPQLDIALLQVADQSVTDLPFLQFGDSENLQLGESVVAIGNALAEFRNSVSVGVVSGLGRSIVASDGMGRSETLDSVIQTDAAINPGNSGGPLVNLRGEVIGVNVATSRGADNISFALPAHVVETVVQSVEEFGEIVRPYIGVRYANITSQIAERDNLTVEYGALIVGDAATGLRAVMPGSPADSIGLQAGDIILSIDDTKLEGRTLAAVLREYQPGDTVSLTLLIDGTEETVDVTLDRAPQSVQ
jgi:S1-C subfamily serine protease